MHFNRKFTSDCPIRHLWNRPANEDSNWKYLFSSGEGYSVVYRLIWKRTERHIYFSEII